MKKTRIKKLCIILISLIITFILYLYLNKKYGFFVPCLFNKLTGIYCPGCGATRCVLALIKGDITTSFRSNPIFFIMIPFLGIGLIYKCYLYLENKKDNIINKMPNYIWITFIIILLVFGILRNLEEFAYLRP